MNSTNDTIAAISTPPGMGGIGIVRLSGPASVGILSNMFRLFGKEVGKLYQSRCIYYGRVVNPDSGETVDEALVSVMKAPRTYTREDVVEINCHGGPAAVKKTLALVLRHGARLAEPGEFTRRAFENGRIDLTQAEAVMDIIASKTELSLAAAVNQLGGGLKTRVEALRERLVELLALAEVSIDFPEEEVEYVLVDDLLDKGRAVRRDVQALLATYDEGRVLRDGLRVAIVGRPNVGKSSLLNLLARAERAIVTDVPGTTRDTVEEMVNLGGLPVVIIDTAGIRHSEDVVEREGIRRSEEALHQADLALLVLDGSAPLTPEDVELINKVSKYNYLSVINKSDLPQRIGEAAVLSKDTDHGVEAAVLSEAADVERKGELCRVQELANEPSAEESMAASAPGMASESVEALKAASAPVFISAKTSAGLDELISRMKASVDAGLRERPPEVTINLRHKEALIRAQEALTRFDKGCADGLSQEFLALELRDALDAVGDIVGRTTPEAILEKIFNDFCIGK